MNKDKDKSKKKSEVLLNTLITIFTIAIIVLIGFLAYQYNKDKICLIRIFCLFIYKQLKYFYYALNILFRAFLMKTIDNRKK